MSWLWVGAAIAVFGLFMGLALILASSLSPVQHTDPHRLKQHTLGPHELDGI